jgi:hypothetical protein
VHILNESILVKSIQEINEEATRFNMMNLERWGDSLKILQVISKTIGIYMLNV